MENNINDINKLVEEMLNNQNTFESDELIDEDEVFKIFYEQSSTNSMKKDTRYNYSAVKLEEVVSNPNEYIIPECQPACKALWDKNIETYMASNYNDNCLYVLLDNLSEENEMIINELIKIDDRYYFSKFRNAYGISVKSTDKNSENELLSLTSVFILQDTLRYQSAESFLSNYKRNPLGISSTLLEYIPENPELSDITLEEALQKTGKSHLYIPEEDRVYENSMYLKWHQRYLTSLKNDIENDKLKRTK